MKNFLDNYFEGIETISKLIDKSKINQAINTIHKLKNNYNKIKSICFLSRSAL